MKEILQIGITGGIGSGKSLVCRIFQTLGIPVYDADSRAKALMTTDGILISAIRKEFSDLSYDAEGQLNRKYLGDMVFSDPVRLARLNELVHPRVALDYHTWIKAQSGSPYVLKEAALLFESGSHKQLDKIIVVVAPVELRVSRVLKRDAHRTSQQLYDIISRQMPEEDKMKRADYVLHNDERELLIPRVLKLDDEFRVLSASRSN